MGFFAGKFSSGKTVLSLNRRNGGDINQHYDPNEDSIFHSDMPFVLIESTYESGLSDVGNGFFVCQMPSTIANLKYTDPGRVILTAVEINGTHRGFLSGTQTQVGQYSTFFENLAQRRANAFLALTHAFSPSTSLAHGTYNYDSSIGHEESISRRGNGGVVCQAVKATGGNIAGADIVIPFTWKMAGYPPGITSVPIDGGNADYWEPNWSSPIGSAHQGHNWFFVNSSNARGYIGFAETFPPNSNKIFYKETYRDFMYVCRGSASYLGSNSRNTIYVQDWYNVRITRVFWYVLNLRYSNGGMSILGDQFTGSDIKLSPSDFTIKGVNLSRSSSRFINQNSFGYMPGRGDMEFVGNNPAYTGVFGDTTGRCEFIGSSKGSLWSPVGYGASQSQLSLYRFGIAKQWYVDTNSNTIGNEFGPVWGPSNIPLRLFSGYTASTYVGDDINPRFIGAGNYYMSLGSVWLGLPNANSSVIMTTEVIMGNMNAAGQRVAQYKDKTWRIQGRKYQSYTIGDGMFHQILTLPPGWYVPYHTTSAYGNIQKIANIDNFTFTRSSFIYTIKNLGNGYVEYGVMIHAVEDSTIFLPRLRVTIQRLV